MEANKLVIIFQSVVFNFIINLANICQRKDERQTKNTEYVELAGGYREKVKSNY